MEVPRMKNLVQLFGMPVEAPVNLLRSVYQLTHRRARAFGYHYLTGVPDESAATVKHHWSVVADYIRICPFRAWTLLLVLDQALAHTPNGDIAEFGVSSGGTFALMSLLLDKTWRYASLYGYDTFEGLPQTDPRRDPAYKKGQFRAKPEETILLLDRLCEDRSRISLIKGLVERTVSKETLPRLCFAHMDMDLYAPTLHVMRALQEQSVSIVIDDCFDDSGGVYSACLDIGLRVSAGPTGQAVKALKSPDGIKLMWDAYIRFIRDCKISLSPLDRQPLIELANLIEPVLKVDQSKTEAEDK